MNVLHVISGLDPKSGGPSTALFGLAAAQVQAGMNVAVLAGRSGEAPAAEIQRLSAQGVKVQILDRPAWPFRTPKNCRSIAGTAVQPADVVHIHGLWEPLLHHAALEASKLGKPYIIRPCGMLDPWALKQKRLKKAVYLAWRMRGNLNRAAAIHYTTEGERQLCQAMKLRPPTIVVPNGVDLREFDHLPPRGTWRSRHAEVNGQPVIAFMGRLHPGKGMEHLIPALAQIPQATLVVIGPDSHGFQKTLMDLARKHQVADRVVFTGMLRGAERVAALADADVFALPSDHENFGIAVIEALAAGIPVVISQDVQLAPEVEAAGVGSVCMREPSALAAELRRWLDDRELQATARARTQAFVKNYDWQRIARCWTDEYQRLVTSSEGVGGS